MAHNNGKTVQPKTTRLRFLLGGGGKRTIDEDVAVPIVLRYLVAIFCKKILSEKVTINEYDNGSDWEYHFTSCDCLENSRCSKKGVMIVRVNNQTLIVV
jgi:hypothetical protein